VVIKVCRCGICGTDLNATSGKGWDFEAGSIMGHEFVGEVVELGSEVEGLRKGDVLTAAPLATCGKCEACIRGAMTLCPQLKGQMGGFGEYMALAASTTIRLPSTFTPADGALVEPYVVALNGVRAAALKPGERILVLGGGSVALTTIFWAARLGGHRVVALSRSPRRAALALEMGADGFVVAGADEEAEVLEALGGPPEVVFECTGAAGLLSQAIRHVAPFGRVVSIGYCTSPETFVPALAANKLAQLYFTVGYSLREFEYVADHMLSGKVDPKLIVSSVISLDDLPQVFESLRGPHAETKVQVAHQS
jgi:(R,R)-butanediol dehydrogenase/meso-butanediol dehydrogenase/diacetyl reductase